MFGWFTSKNRSLPATSIRPRFSSVLIEALEDRRLLSASVAHHVLHISAAHATAKHASVKHAKTKQSDINVHQFIEKLDIDNRRPRD